MAAINDETSEKSKIFTLRVSKYTACARMKIQASPPTGILMKTEDVCGTAVK